MTTTAKQATSDKTSVRPFHVNVPAAYPRLIHFNKLPKDGHFAAWEQPKLFSEEVRAGFGSLRRDLHKEIRHA